MILYTFDCLLTLWLISLCQVMSAALPTHRLILSDRPISGSGVLHVAQTQSPPATASSTLKPDTTGVRSSQLCHQLLLRSHGLYYVDRKSVAREGGQSIRDPIPNTIGTACDPLNGRLESKHCWIDDISIKHFEYEHCQERDSIPTNFYRASPAAPGNNNGRKGSYGLLPSLSD